MQKNKLHHDLLSSWMDLCRKILVTYHENYKDSPFPKNIMEILLYLESKENVCEPAAIADALYIPRQTMTSLIDSMVKKDLAIRSPHKTDRRRIEIVITEKGKSIAIDFRNRIIDKYQLSMKTVKQKNVLENLTVALKLIDEIQNI